MKRATIDALAAYIHDQVVPESGPFEAAPATVKAFYRRIARVTLSWSDPETV